MSEQPPGAARAELDTSKGTDHEPAGGARVEPAARIADRGIVVDGLRLATAISDAPRPLLARAPLVVLPAVGHPWSDYRPILERFAGERRVFAIDWPGFGGSDKPAPASFDYSSERYAGLLSGWLDALGIARAVLLGNGVGAAAALRYAATSPERVAGLALIAPAGFTPRGLTLALMSRLLGTPSLLRRFEPAFTSLYLGPDIHATRAIVEAHRALHVSPDYPAVIQASAALWRSAARPSEQLGGVGARVSAPTIVVRGALDPICAAGDARRATEAIGAHGALEIVLPVAGHLPFLQQPERFYQAIAGLLQTAELKAAELT